MLFEFLFSGQCDIVYTLIEWLTLMAFWSHVFACFKLSNVLPTRTFYFFILCIYMYEYFCM